MLCGVAEGHPADFRELPAYGRGMTPLFYRAAVINNNHKP